MTHAPFVPIQHVAPVANDVEWFYLAGAIALLAALINYGILAKAKRWEKHGVLSMKHVFLADVFAASLAVASGTIAGYLCWHWALGFVTALAGASADAIVIYTALQIRKKFL